MNVLARQSDTRSRAVIVDAMVSREPKHTGDARCEWRLSGRGLLRAGDAMFADPASKTVSVSMVGYANDIVFAGRLKGCFPKRL